MSYHLIDSPTFTILVFDNQAHFFQSTSDSNSLDQAKAFIADNNLKTYQFDISYVQKVSPALLAKYGFALGSPEPEQLVEQPICKLNNNNPCKICGKTSFKTPLNCANPLQSIKGGWQCQLNDFFVGTARVTRSDFIVQYRGGKL